MRITVHAKPGAKEERIESLEDGVFSIAVREPPREGRANAAIVRVVAQHFGVPVSRVHLVAGYTARQKVFVIDS